jgi:hypothetical protein
VCASRLVESWLVDWGGVAKKKKKEKEGKEEKVGEEKENEMNEDWLFVFLCVSA